MSLSDEHTSLLAAAGLPTVDTFTDRLAAVPTPARALYRAVLEEFATHGTAPDLPATAASVGLDAPPARQSVDALAAADLVALDGNGVLAGAFPFCAVPTRHQVSLRDGPTVYAMCAVDALGIPAMLGRAGVITSRDPVTETTVTVDVDGDEIGWEPPDAAVLVARVGTGPLATSCCRVIDFYAARAGAERALALPGLRGVVLSVPEAHALGVGVFGELLTIAAPVHVTNWSRRWIRTPRAR
jgi:hypothetical protein